MHKKYLFGFFGELDRLGEQGNARIGEGVAQIVEEKAQVVRVTARVVEESSGSQSNRSDS